MHLKNLSFDRRFIGLALWAIGASYYLINFHNINSLELWSDEVGVIQIAESPFSLIARSVFMWHASALPLDYWNMWAWNHIVIFFSKDYQEFIYRIPYMIFHIVAGIILVFYALNQASYKRSYLEKMFIGICIFLLYFLNPFLLQYSYEVRFYALSFLGVILAVRMMDYGSFYSTKNFPIVVIFTVNSIYQHIIVIPYLVWSLCDKKNRRQAIFMLGIFVGLFVIFFHKMLIATVPQTIPTFSFVMSPLVHMHEVLLAERAQFIFLLGIIVYGLCFFTKKTVYFLSLFLWSITIVIAIALYSQYASFHVRHYLFALPIMYFLLVTPLFRLKRRASIIYVIALTSVFTYSWINGQMQGALGLPRNFSKSIYGFKDAVVMASKITTKQIVTYSSDEPGQGAQISLLWYARRYKSAPPIIASNEREACLLESAFPEVVFIDILNRGRCPDVVKVKIFPETRATIYSRISM